MRLVNRLVEELIAEIKELDIDEIHELADNVENPSVAKEQSTDSDSEVEGKEPMEMDDWSVEPWRKYFKAKKRRQDILFPEDP